jgi:hypothetical protein
MQGFFDIEVWQDFCTHVRINLGCGAATKSSLLLSEVATVLPAKGLTLWRAPRLWFLTMAFEIVGSLRFTGDAGRLLGQQALASGLDDRTAAPDHQDGHMEGEV